MAVELDQVPLEDLANSASQDPAGRPVTWRVSSMGCNMYEGGLLSVLGPVIVVPREFI